jgi:hypothetical protein
MVACQDCGVDFFNEFEPLSTICAACVDERDSYYEKWAAEYADSIDEEEDVWERTKRRLGADKGVIIVEEDPLPGGD